MSKKMKKVAGGTIGGVAISNLCCGLLLLTIVVGGMVVFGTDILAPHDPIGGDGEEGTDDGSSGGSSGTDDSGDSGDSGDTTPTPTQWVLVARLNSWDSMWPNPGYDINVEVFDAETSSKVHSGLLLDEIFIEYNNHDWVVGTTHESLVTDFMVTIQVYGLGGTLLLTANDYVDIPVGSAEATYDLYDGYQPSQRAGSISLKWQQV